MTLNELSHAVLDSAFEVRKVLGAGLLESAYEAALEYELKARGLDVKRQVPMFMKYKGVNVGESYRLDLLVNDQLIIECKATEKNNPLYASQCLTYLRAANLKLGLVINFGIPMLKNGIERVVNHFNED